MERNQLKTGIIIPTYNHGATVAAVITDCLHYLDRIIVVVDGATDDTVNRLGDLPVHLVQLPRNRGKGAALKVGFLEAEKLGWQQAITIDSDGQHFATNIPDFIRASQQYPETIIIGDRQMNRSDIPGPSKFGKKFTNFWLKVETGKEIADGQSGFRSYPVSLVNRLSCRFNRYEFEVEILARAVWAGIDIRSIPVAVEYQPSGGRISHFRPFVDNFRTSILNTLLVMIRIGQLGMQLFKIRAT